MILNNHWHHEPIYLIDQEMMSSHFPKKLNVVQAFQPHLAQNPNSCFFPFSITCLEFPEDLIGSSRADYWALAGERVREREWPIQTI